MQASRLLNDEDIVAFDEALNGYQPRQDLRQAFMDMKLGVIMGSAGSGKDTLRQDLLQKWPEDYRILLSDTTRPPRPQEVSGQEYVFKPVSEVLEGFLHREYLQGKLVHNQQVSGLHESQILGGDIRKIALPILVIETEAELYAIKPDIKSIFLVPPDAKELSRRLAAGRNMTPEEADRRMQSARIEIASALEEPRYYFVLSGDLEAKTQVSNAYFRDNHWDEAQNQAARTAAQAILQDIQAA